MTGFQLLALSVVSPALLILAASPANAQQQGAYGGGPRVTLPSHSNNFSWEGKPGFRGGFPGAFYVGDRETVTIIEREVVREVPAQPAVVVPPPEPRKPYVIGATYASLPGGCMKMIEGVTSYYYCDGEWYRQIAEGRSPAYKAVAKP